MNPQKCMFVIISGPLFGFIMSNDKIRVDPFKFEEILGFPPPFNVHQLQILKGKANFLQRFIVNYIEIAKGFKFLLNHTGWFGTWKPNFSNIIFTTNVSNIQYMDHKILDLNNSHLFWINFLNTCSML